MWTKDIEGFLVNLACVEQIGIDYGDRYCSVYANGTSGRRRYILKKFPHPRMKSETDTSLEAAQKFMEQLQQTIECKYGFFSVETPSFEQIDPSRHD